MKARPETANRLLENHLIGTIASYLFLVFLLASTVHDAIAQNPIITTFAGTGERGFYEGDNNNALTAKYQSISGITSDAEGNVYVSDFQNFCIRKIDINGKTSIVAGIPTVSASNPPATGVPNAGVAAATAIPGSGDLAVGAEGTLYFGLGSFQTGGITPTGNLFYSPSLSPSFASIAIYGDYMYRGSNGSVTVLNRHTNEVVGTITGTGSVRGIAIDASGNLYFSNQGGTITYAAAGQFTATTYVPYHIDLLVNTGDLAIDPDGNLYFVNNMDFVIKIDPATKSRRFIYIPGARSLRGLAVGPNGDVFVVDAGGCKVYKIGLPSRNANLNALTTDAGTLTPEFSADQLTYTASVPFNTPSVKLTPTLADATARIAIRINNGSFSSLSSGTASAALPLNVGDNIIDIRVNAQDASVQKDYQLTITRIAPIPGEATIVTVQPTAIRAYSAILGGNITDDGGETLTERGVEYSVMPGFEWGTGMKVPALAAEVGAYTVEVTALDAGTTYYARAYAVNAAATTYGPEVRFTTNTLPTVANINLTGTAEVGRTLNGTYTYSDAEQHTENGSTYAWYRYDAANGAAGRALIDGANTVQYTLQVADEGKFIALEVTPHDGMDAGVAGESNRVGPIELGILPDAANRLYVKKGNTEGNGSGSSWQDALPELADALHWARERWLESATETGWNAENPLEIWVTEGTYMPSFNAADNALGQNGNRDNAFVLVPYVQLYGGFAGGEASKELRDWNAHDTRLSGDLDNTNTWSNSDAYHVVVAVGQTNYPIDHHVAVDGFTITGGHGNGDHGSMISVNGRNLNRNFGGGIAHLSASPTLSNLRIIANLGFNGGAVYNHSSSPRMKNVSIMGNSGGNGGGMINQNFSSPIIINSIITGNVATDGGGLFNMLSSPMLVNVTFAGNQANTGGAVSNNSGSATLHNSIVWGNNSGLAGSGFTVTHSLVQGSAATTNGNINGSTDPGFVDAKAPGLNVGGDYRVATSSVTVNKGNNATYTNAGGNLAGDLDFSGNARLSGCNIDLGAYELQGQICIAPSADNVFYVNQAVDNNSETYTGKGDSWENAVTELADVLKWAREQWGLDGSGASWGPGKPHETLKILVAKGTYRPKYTPEDNHMSPEYPTDIRDKAFLLVSNVQIFGGFEGVEPEHSDLATLLANRDLEQHETLLSADIDGDDTSNGLNRENNGYHVVVVAGSVGLAELNGLSLVGGHNGLGGTILVNGAAIARNDGGGIHIRNSSPSLTAVTVRNNTAAQGGAIYNRDGSPKLQQVTITANSSGQMGGGIYSQGGAPVLVDVSISENAAHVGGGIYNEMSTMKLINGRLKGNRAEVNGGGIHNNASDMILTNTVISGNHAPEGGGLYNSASSPVLTNVTISGNYSSNSGAGVRNTSSGTVTINNSLIWGNVPYNQFSSPGTVGLAGSHNLIEGLTGHNELGSKVYEGSADELFVAYQAATANQPTGAGDFNLGDDSPVINQGSNEAYMHSGGELTTEVDLAGNPRLKWGAIDIGAYEYQKPPAPALGFPVAGTYKIGDELVFTVDFYAPVTLTGAATLPFSMGESEIAAVLTEFAADKQVATFAYTVVEGNVADEGLEMRGGIELESGGTIVFEDGGLGEVRLTYMPVSNLTLVRIDGIRPTLTEVTIATDNANSVAAKIGDKVTVNIKASEAIDAPEVEIAGNKASVSTVGDDGLAWRAEYQLIDSDEAGAIGFSIGGISDKAGNTAPDVTTTTDESRVTFYNTDPVIEGVQDGEYYNEDVTITFDEGTATLNGEPYEAGTPITEAGGYKLTVTDPAGNTKTVAFTIDKTAPVVEGAADGGHYNADVTITFDEGTATLNGEPYEAGTPVTEAGEYELIVTDAAGNMTVVTFTIDKTAPVVEGVEDGGYYNEDVTVTFNEGTATLNGQPYESGTPITEAGGYKLTVTDPAGNTTTVAFTIDKTAPMVEGAADGGHYNADVMITFDEGIATLNGQPYEPGTLITEEGSYKLTVIDAAGNMTVVTFTIDKTAPLVEGVEDGGYYNEDVTVTFNEGTATLNGQPYEAGTPITGAGGYKLTVTDPAGNTTTVAFTIDKTAPLVEGVEDGGYYNEDVTITFDEGTATLNGQPYEPGTLITEEGSYMLTVIDAAGNVTVIAFTIDKTDPLVEGAQDGNYYNEDVTVAFNEGTATLNGKPYVTGTPITEEGVYVLVVTDKAGNITTVNFTVDKTAPEVTGVTDGAYYNEEVMVSFNEGKATLNGKPYVAGTPITEAGDYVLIVTDAAGNETRSYFTIDKTAPVVEGVENDRSYSPGVEIGFNEGKAMLNGEPYLPGTPIMAGGAYTLVVTDAAGNETVVRFMVGSVSSPPAGIAATAGNRQVALEWQTPVDGVIPITDYRIEYSADGGQRWTLAEHEPSSMTRAVVIGLENNRPYQFRIAAVNAAGTGAFSSVVTAIPTEPMPDGEGNLPEPEPGETVVITDGKVEAVVLEVVDGEYLRLRGDGYALMLASLGVDGERIPISAIDAVIRLVRGAGAAVYISGNGFEPGTVVTVYLFSVPELVGHIPVQPDGTFARTLPVPVHLEAGRHTLQANGIVAGGGERSVSVGLLLVDNKPQEIGFATFADRTYGDGPVELLASATSGLPISYTVTDAEGNVTDVASLGEGNALHIHGAGEVVITAAQAGDLEYGPANPVSRTLRIAKAPLRVGVADATRAYGQANPAFGLSYSGFVNGEDASVLAVRTVAATVATETSAPGSYAITVSGGESDNYAFTYSGATLVITKAQQSITFAEVGEVSRDTGSIMLSVSASSGLPVGLSVSDEQVATLEGNTLRIHRLGTVRITATQSGDGNHGAAEPVVVAVRVVDPSSSFPVRVHQAVSPNGDGINEFLMVEGIRDYPENRVTVFNRNGTIVWEASGYDNDRVAFRGIGTGQLRLAAGTYFYIVEAKVDGKLEYRKGYFVLRY